MSDNSRRTLRYGDIIEALPGTTAHLFSEGRRGKVVETRSSGDPEANNLVRWDGDEILMGFHVEDVRIVS